MSKPQKVIRNLGYLAKDERKFITRVEYDCRTFDFAPNADTTVDEDVALYVVTQHGGQGLNIPADPSNPKHAKELEIARLRDHPPPAPVVAEDAAQPAAPTFVTADPAAVTLQPGQPEPAPADIASAAAAQPPAAPAAPKAAPKKAAKE